MKRGVLTITRPEFDVLFSSVNWQKLEGSTVHNKAHSVGPAQEGVLANVSLDLSENELEILLDEVGLPDPEKDTEELKSLRMKISQMLIKFREEL